MHPKEPDMLSGTNRRILPTWRSMHADTAPWAERMQLDFYREAPAWKKLQMAADLTEATLQLAETGLFSRHPLESPSEIRRRLADLMLGPELAARVYGPIDHSRDTES